MSQQEKLQSALADLARLQEQITAITTSLKRFPEEPAVGTVLKIFKRHQPAYYVISGRDVLNPGIYTYAAVRATPRAWFLTGRNEAGRPKTWDELVEFIGDSEVEEATAWKVIGGES